MLGGKKTDWAKFGSVAFVLGLIGVMIANNFVEGVSLPIVNIIFFVLVGFALYLTLLLVREAKKTQEISFIDMIVYVGILIGIGYFIIKFNIAPAFSIALQSLIP